MLFLRERFQQFIRLAMLAALLVSPCALIDASPSFAGQSVGTETPSTATTIQLYSAGSTSHHDACCCTASGIWLNACERKDALATVRSRVDFHILAIAPGLLATRAQRPSPAVRSLGVFIAGNSLYATTQRYRI